MVQNPDFITCTAVPDNDFTGLASLRLNWLGLVMSEMSLTSLLCIFIFYDIINCIWPKKVFFVVVVFFHQEKLFLISWTHEQSVDTPLNTSERPICSGMLLKNKQNKKKQPSQASPVPH